MQITRTKTTLQSWFTPNRSICPSSETQNFWRTWNELHSQEERILGNRLKFAGCDVSFRALLLGKELPLLCNRGGGMGTARAGWQPGAAGGSSPWARTLQPLQRPGESSTFLMVSFKRSSSSLVLDLPEHHHSAPRAEPSAALYHWQDQEFQGPLGEVTDVCLWVSTAFFSPLNVVFLFSSSDSVLSHRTHHFLVCWPFLVVQNDLIMSMCFPSGNVVCFIAMNSTLKKWWSYHRI